MPHIDLSKVLNWVQKEIEHSRGFPRVLVQVKAGKELDIPFVSQWLVDRGKLLGIECPTHVKMINIASAKLEQVRLELNKEEEERQKKTDGKV
jgi:hypothetical protein